VQAFIVKLTWKVFAGFFLAVVAALTLLISMLLRSVKVAETWLPQIILGIAGTGLVLVIVGYLTQRRPRTRSQKAGLDTSEAQPLHFFYKFAFWGAILLLGAGPIYLFTRVTQAAPKSPPTVAVTRPAPPIQTNPLPAVVFPQLTLKGYVANGQNSTAVINRKTFQLGETITNGVTVVAISAEGVVVELQGERKVLRLE